MADLNQGIMFKKFIKKHKKKTNYKSLKLISSGKLNIVNNLKTQFNYSNFKEGIQMQMQTDMPVENAVTAVNMAELNELKAIEMKFNKDMTKYTQLYKKYLFLR